MGVRAILRGLATVLLLVAIAGCASSADSETSTVSSKLAVEPDWAESPDSPDENDSGDTAASASTASGAPDASEESAGTATAKTTTEAGDSDELAAANGASTQSNSNDEGSEASEQATAPPAETPLGQLTAELIDFVESERGLTFTNRPEVVILDSDAFIDAWGDVISKDVADNRVDYENLTDIYRAMGIIDGGQTLEDIWIRFGDAGVLGFYDSTSSNITLRSGEITAFTRTVLVHELVHALEDQVFDLNREEYGDRTDEIDWTFSALAEGSARVIEARYRAQFSDAERAEEDAARQSIPRTVSLSEFTPSFLELQLGRYRYGTVFVEALWERGQESLDAAYANPPSTSELILDPESFLLGADPEPSVPAPPADAEVFVSGVWGEAAWAAVLTDSTERTAALEIANGWGGDSYVAWRTASGSCVRSHIAADSSAELDEYAVALEQWASEGANRSIFYPTADNIEVTACG